MTTKDNITQAIHALGIENKAICLHSSLKSFGRVDGGAQTIVDAFLDSGCTILVPTFTYDNETAPIQGHTPPRNAYDYANPNETFNTRIFTTDSTDITLDAMGVIPQCVAQNPQRKRGYNPLNSFSAIGAHADALVRDQSPTNLYASFETLCKLDGYVLLAGVTLTKATIIHYAEQLAGRNLFLRWANDTSGNPIPVRVGSCSEGFNNLMDSLKPILSTITVGESQWLCYPAKEMVEIGKNAILQNPEITRCSDQCGRCDDAIAGGPICE